MNMVFADTWYWLAIFNPHDPFHESAKKASQSIHPAIIITSEMVLVEFLNAFAGRGEQLRERAAQTVRALQKDPNVKIHAQTQELFRGALELYENRLDKAWTLTDCASMHIMDRKEIRDVLTGDHHFRQASFNTIP